MRPGGSDHGLPWAIHLVWIGLVLVLATVFVGFSAFVYIDEAAIYAQVDLVEDGTWTVPRPLGATDVSQQWAPMNNSTVVGDEFAPFPNHPLHVVIAAAADRLGGSVGVRALSTFGVLAAAATAGVLASVVGRREAIAAAAITALASPLLFDAQLVVAHAIAAPLAGGLAVLAFARPATPLRVRLLGAGALAVVGSLLRSEFIVYALAVAAVVVVTAAFRERRSAVAISATVVAGSVGAYLLEPVWISRLVGEGIEPKVISASSQGGFTGRGESVLTVLIGTGSPRAVVLVLAVALSAVAVAVARWRPTATPVAVGASLVGATMAVAQLFDPTVVPGVVWAFPLLTVAALSARRNQLARPLARALTACAVFAVVVLVLQYRAAGGFEWGWRYVHIALPVVAAAMARPVLALLDTARTVERRIVVAGVGVVALLVPVGGVLQQRRHVEATQELLDAVDMALERTDAQLIVSTERLFGRYIWSQSISGRVVTTTRNDASGVLPAAEAAGYERILLVWAGVRPDPDLSDYTAERSVLSLPGPFEAQLLAR